MDSSLTALAFPNPLQLLVLDASHAHREGIVEYGNDGWVTLRHPRLERLTADGTVRVPPAHQFPLIRATFDDLNKALSSRSNSPSFGDGKTVRALYEDEVAAYDALCASVRAAGGFEPDYGTYVFDPRARDLYLIAPKRWHRLALVTSNAHLLVDPEGRLSWYEARRRLEGAVVGFAGVSVGGNLLEGWLREARPDAVKIADPDWVELTNFNRGERMSLRHACASRAERMDLRNPYDCPRVSKVEYAAYEAQLVDPFLTCFTYGKGLKPDNIERFLGGDGKSEPPIDILVEEMDDLEMKVLVREAARRRGVDVVMLSDFGHRVNMLWNYFRDDPKSRLGSGASDDDLQKALAATRGGERSRMWAFAAALCGPDLSNGAFANFVEGRGEQPTASLPQSGATSMAAGAIGGKEIALRILGHHRGDPSPSRVVYDLLDRQVTSDGAAR